MSEENPPQTAQRHASQVISSIGSKLYLDSATADVTFIVGRNDDQCERLPAHKLLLITASEVFETMFNGSWKERDEVRIVDATTGSFKEFLQFFYLHEVELTMENVKDVMNLGKKYGIDDCLNVCAEFLITNLTDDNVCSAYKLAILFEHDKLRNFCDVVTSENIKNVFQSTSFAESDREVVHAILSLNAMKCTEAELFEAAMTWIKTKSRKNVLTKRLIRAHLGDLFEEFRFGSMSIEEFSKLVPSYGKIFSNEEYQDIIQMIASPDHESKYFSDDRDKRSEATIWDDEDLWEMDRSWLMLRSERPYCIKEIETTAFSTSELVFLSDFRCSKVYEYYHGRCVRTDKDYTTRISISECADGLEFNGENSSILYSGKSSLRATNSMTQAILLKPGFTYEITCQQCVPINLCTRNVLKTELKIEPNVTIRFHDDPTIQIDDGVQGLFQHFEFVKFETD